MNAPATSAVCILTALISWAGFHEPRVHRALIFEPEAILARRQWHRLVSSALLHGGWAHLFFNLITIHSFGSSIEFGFGPAAMLGIYVLSVLGGSLLSLYVHRHHAYSALGASGGACGLLFAAIFLQPGTGVSIYFLPISIPGPVYAIAYLVGTFVAMRRGGDNIGHDAHFGGATVGLIAALVLAPEACLASPWLFGACVLAAAGGIYLVFHDPIALRKAFQFGREETGSAGRRDQDYAYARKRNEEAKAIDAALEKVAARGLASLTEKERALLESASARARKG